MKVNEVEVHQLTDEVDVGVVVVGGAAGGGMPSTCPTATSTTTMPMLPSALDRHVSTPSTQKPGSPNTLRASLSLAVVLAQRSCPCTPWGPGATYKLCSLHPAYPTHVAGVVEVCHPLVDWLGINLVDHLFLIQVQPPNIDQQHFRGEAYNARLRNREKGLK